MRVLTMPGNDVVITNKLFTNVVRNWAVDVAWVRSDVNVALLMCHNDYAWVRLYLNSFRCLTTGTARGYGMV